MLSERPEAPAGTGGDARLARLVLLALLAAAFVAGCFPILESDLFWHLATGRWMLEHGSVPRVDPFRFTPAGLPWIDHEWLFQLGARGIEVVGGLDGLILARAAALALFAALLFGLARRSGLGAGIAGMVALWGLFGVRPRFLFRPEIVTLFALVLLLFGLERWLATRRRTLLVSLALLVVLWVNAHGQAMLAPVVSGLFLLGARWSGERLAWREVVGPPLLFAGCLLANPYGWRLVLVPLGILGALRDLPAANPEWLSSFAAPQPYLYAGYAAVLALAFAARRASGRWPAPAWTLPALAMAGLALTGVRHQALFFAAATPLVAASLAVFPEAAANWRRARGFAALAIVGALAAGLWAAVPPASGPLRARHGGLAFGFGLAADRFPVCLAEELAAHPEVGPLYNDLVHGGYLVWRLSPPRQVFLDGRMELRPELLHEIAAARGSNLGWEALLTRYGAVGALVGYDARERPLVERDASGRLREVDRRTASSLLFPPESFDLVAWDDAAMLFLKRGASGWPGVPYRFLQPEDLGWTLRRAAEDPVFRAGALAEAERKLAEEPDSARARFLVARLRSLPPA